MGLLLRAPVLAFPRSHVFGLLRNYAHLIAFRRQPTYRHLSSVHHSRGGYSAEEPGSLRRLKMGGVVLIWHPSSYLKAATTALLIRYVPFLCRLASLSHQARHYAAERVCIPPHMPRVLTETATPLRPPTCLWTVA
jgi:hypothetical protein